MPLSSVPAAPVDVGDAALAAVRAVRDALEGGTMTVGDGPIYHLNCLRERAAAVQAKYDQVDHALREIEVTAQARVERLQRRLRQRATVLQIELEQIHHELQHPEAWSLDVLEMSIRAYNRLKRAEIVTVGDLVQWSESDLLKLHGLGLKTLRKIKSHVEGLGLTLARGFVGHNEVE